MLYICIAGKPPQPRKKKRHLSFLKETKACSPTAMEEWCRLLPAPSHFNIVCETALSPQKKTDRNGVYQSDSVRSNPPPPAISSGSCQHKARFCIFKFHQSLLGVPLLLASGEMIIANVHDFIHNIQYRVKLAFIAFRLFFLTIYFNTFGIIIPNICQLARWGFLCHIWVSLFLILSSWIIHSNASWLLRGFCYYYLLIRNLLCPVQVPLIVW